MTAGAPSRKPGRGEPRQLHTKLWCSLNADMLRELAARMTMREGARHLHLKVCELLGFTKSLGIENWEWKTSRNAPPKTHGHKVLLTLEALEQVVLLKLLKKALCNRNSLVCIGTLY
jgi:hypothetical protein